jgi:hypothetical protein
VLRANRWFAASRLPGSYPYRSGRSKGAGETAMPEQNALNHADSQGAQVLMQFVNRSEQDHRPMRPVLIVLGATALTLVLLWWIMHPY